MTINLVPNNHGLTKMHVVWAYPLVLLIIGWTAVQRAVKIIYDLENFPLQIRTNSLMEKSEQVNVNFYTAKDGLAGGVSFRLTSSPEYLLGWCTTWTKFPTSLPSETDKVWTVLNAVISASTCTSDNSWSNYWSRDVQRIMFPSDSTNTASDYYRQGMCM